MVSSGRKVKHSVLFFFAQKPGRCRCGFHEEVRRGTPMAKVRQSKLVNVPETMEHDIDELGEVKKRIGASSEACAPSHCCGSWTSGDTAFGL